MIKKREWVIETFGVSHPVASMALAVLALVVSSVVLPSEAVAQARQDLQDFSQRHCSGCHALDDDHEGPRLRGVVGRPAGTVKTFPIFGSAQRSKTHVGRRHIGRVADGYGVCRAR
jgi:cytochrome c